LEAYDALAPDSPNARDVHGVWDMPS
jgi:hypothetical protein